MRAESMPKARPPSIISRSFSCSTAIHGWHHNMTAFYFQNHNYSLKDVCVIHVHTSACCCQVLLWSNAIQNRWNEAGFPISPLLMMNKNIMSWIKESGVLVTPPLITKKYKHIIALCLLTWCSFMNKRWRLLRFLCHFWKCLKRNFQLQC